MNNTAPTRRDFLKAAGIGLALGAAGAGRAAEAPPARPAGFRFSLNTGTIRGCKLALPAQIELAARAGYGGIEPWLSDVESFAAGGGALGELRKRCADAGLAVVGAIGFAPWAVNDDAARAKGVEQMKRDMGRVAELGGTHIAAPPAGVNGAGTVLDFDRAGERYRVILEAGREAGVIPQLEFWGSSANLSRLDQALHVAARAGHPDACILADAFHLYKGGSEPAALRLLGPPALHCFHMNDYPADPPRETIKDSNRVWPGDGIAPLKEILATFRANGVSPWLSVEVFNPEYWKLPPDDIARTGLAKLKAVAG